MGLLVCDLFYLVGLLFCISAFLRLFQFFPSLMIHFLISTFVLLSDR